MNDALWREKIDEAKNLKDKLGTPIDPEILETVAAFRALDFPTSQSCAGHDGSGSPFPWVEVYADRPEGWSSKKKETSKEWRENNFRHRERMISLMEEFYRGRGVPFDARLTLMNIGVFGGFRVQSLGAESIGVCPQEEQGERLLHYRKEMSDFTEFLKDRL
jgi:hypothetical protein